jgi:hypothetical protein
MNGTFILRNHVDIGHGCHTFPYEPKLFKGYE